VIAGVAVECLRISFVTRFAVVGTATAWLVVAAVL
jgi:hypothetical protein